MPLAAAAPIDRIENRDRLLLKVIDSNLAGGARTSGQWLACGVGCTECCIGPFPITMLDTRRLQHALAELESREPARAAAIRERARLSAALMSRHFPGDPAAGILADDAQREEQFCAAYQDIPCPVLDPVSGACQLYNARPVSCRTFGPPVRMGNESLPPCRLCFVGASDAEVEASRVQADPHGVEDFLLAELQVEGVRGHTIIAFALAGAPPNGA